MEESQGADGVSAAPLLRADKVSKAFQGFLAVAGADLEVSAGEIVGIIGPNGAGKSTFFNCLSGELAPSSGAVRFDGVDVTHATPEEHARLGIARTYQVPATFEDMTILDNVMVGAFLRHSHQADAREEATRILEFTGLKAQADHRAKSLGTPGRKRLEIARALATRPRLLLLDEALSGLTPLEIQQAIALVRDIHRMGVTLMIVEHIMEVVLTLAQRVIVFNHGEIIATGRPGEIASDPKVIAAYLGAQRRSRRSPSASDGQSAGHA
ncbi:MAG TPA: ABC transporter ATP-binding protein [Candidatus Sulfotelmatobacter sp.]|nr:ABC transporter ATP-binding protein [Candidatus Sulfotelmatobacter sp.]